MKAQQHGNVCVTETGPRTQPISTSCCLLTLSSVFCLAIFFGCLHNPPADKNGKLPDDAVRRFIELVRASDYDGARKLWYGPSKLVFQPSDPQEKTIDLTTKFEDFCKDFKKIDLKTCRTTVPRGKSGFSMVEIDWEESGEKKHYLFGLKIVDGEWKMERGYYW